MQETRKKWDENVSIYWRGYWGESEFELMWTSTFCNINFAKMTLCCSSQPVPLGLLQNSMRSQPQVFRARWELLLCTSFRATGWRRLLSSSVGAVPFGPVSWRVGNKKIKVSKWIAWRAYLPAGIIVFPHGVSVSPHHTHTHTNKHHFCIAALHSIIIRISTKM